LGHICAVSGVSAVVESQRLPLSDAARHVLGREPARVSAALAGGDDYELLFAAPTAAADALATLSQELGLSLTAIGRFGEGSGVMALDAQGAMALPVTGYRHF
jgi:thiamine-monophosphate kinase